MFYRTSDAKSEAEHKKWQESKQYLQLSSVGEVADQNFSMMNTDKEQQAALLFSFHMVCGNTYVPLGTVRGMGLVELPYPTKQHAPLECSNEPFMVIPMLEAPNVITPKLLPHADDIVQYR